MTELQLTDGFRERLRSGQADTITLRGDFALTVCRNGQNITYLTGKNLIVNAGKTEVAKLLGNTRNTGIAKIGLGTGSTAAAAGDTTLTSMFSKAIATIEYPAPGQVRFNWFVDYGEANGLSVREFGLLFSDNTLFARFVRGSSILKDSDITLEGQWTIYT